VSSDVGEGVKPTKRALHARRSIAVGCFMLATPLVLVGLVLAFVAGIEAMHPWGDELPPPRDLLSICAFFLPGMALWFLGGYLWSRSG
jgi:hypothetical protein